ncbi:MAG: TetR family transcriptional regulator [Bacteroidetes bacterium]|nr:MAG: TetR family transcriptional regulator [Bacteroidota bacterium]
MVVVKAEVRSQIIDVARKIFTRYGFRKTTMEEIAIATGKGKSSIYYYFPGKEDIFRAVVEREVSELRQHLAFSIGKDERPDAKLKAYMLFRLHHVRTLSNFYAALNEEDLSHLDFILDIRQKFEEEERKILRSILAEGMQRGQFQIKSAEIGAVAISTMMKGLELPLFLSADYKGERELVLDDVIRVLFSGILKR